jgi:hypothetical protein
VIEADRHHPLPGQEQGQAPEGGVRSVTIGQQRLAQDDCPTSQSGRGAVDCSEDLPVTDVYPPVPCDCAWDVRRMFGP